MKLTDLAGVSTIMLCMNFFGINETINTVVGLYIIFEFVMYMLFEKLRANLQLLADIISKRLQIKENLEGRLAYESKEMMLGLKQIRSNINRDFMLNNVSLILKAIAATNLMIVSSKSRLKKN